MVNSHADCIICRGAAGDVELQRIEVWQDAHWRLTTSLFAEVPGFSYLEPKRHIPHITDLDGEEASTLGVVLAQVSRALRDATQAELVYVYVFGGGVPHLHLHLAPHRPGDALNTQMIQGAVVEKTLDTGVTVFESDKFAPLPETELRSVAERIRQRLTESGGAE
jgi:diadenosine tetraphosphate (Ap4A) HIT family hydrolase